MPPTVPEILDDRTGGLARTNFENTWLDGRTEWQDTQKTTYGLFGRGGMSQFPSKTSLMPLAEAKRLYSGRRLAWAWVGVPCPRKK
jgi:hypothetical protein